MIICKMQQKEKAAPSERSTGPGASDGMRSQPLPDTMEASRARFPPSLRQHVGGALSWQWHAMLRGSREGKQTMFKAVGHRGFS